MGGSDLQGLHLLRLLNLVYIWSLPDAYRNGSKRVKLFQLFTIQFLLASSRSISSRYLLLSMSLAGFPTDSLSIDSGFRLAGTSRRRQTLLIRAAASWSSAPLSPSRRASSIAPAHSHNSFMPLDLWLFL